MLPTKICLASISVIPIESQLKTDSVGSRNAVNGTLCLTSSDAYLCVSAWILILCQLQCNVYLGMRIVTDMLAIFQRCMCGIIVMPVLVE